jgi:hypothetical protein
MSPSRGSYKGAGPLRRNRRGRLQSRTDDRLLRSIRVARSSLFKQKTGQIIYQGRFDDETSSNYIVDVSEGVRDFYPKRICQRDDPSGA